MKRKPPLNETIFKNKTYDTILPVLEQLEHDEQLIKNGHHMAQRLCDMLWDAFKDEIEVHSLSLPMLWDAFKDEIEVHSLSLPKSIITPCDWQREEEPYDDMQIAEEERDRFMSEFPED